MYRTLQIKNFRGFSDLTVSGLEQINLIAGANNVGKTALLEALFLHQGATNPELPIRLLAFRGLSGLNYEADALWGHLFYQFDLQRQIDILTWDRAQVKRSLSITVEEAQSMTTRRLRTATKNDAFGYTQTFPQELLLTSRDSDNVMQSRVSISQDGLQYERSGALRLPDGIFLTSRWDSVVIEDTQRYSKLESVGLEGQILHALQLIEPRLTRITVVLIGALPVIHGDIGVGRLIPLPLMGEGMGRLLSLLLAIANVPNGLVLIDEVENGLHHSVIYLVWKAIASFAQRFNVQVFATTHSEECVQAAHQASIESEAYNFRLFRLQRVRQTMQAVSHDQEMLTAALEVGLEVR